MFGSHKVKIEGELLDKVKQCSDAAGYESLDEFVIHVLEKETKKIKGLKIYALKPGEKL